MNPGETNSLNDLAELGETLTERVIGSGPGKTARRKSQYGHRSPVKSITNPTKSLDMMKSVGVVKRK